MANDGSTRSVNKCFVCRMLDLFDESLALLPWSLWQSILKHHLSKGCKSVFYSLKVLYTRWLVYSRDKSFQFLLSALVYSRNKSFHLLVFAMVCSRNINTFHFLLFALNYSKTSHSTFWYSLYFIHFILVYWRYMSVFFLVFAAIISETNHSTAHC